MPEPRPPFQPDPFAEARGLLSDDESPIEERFWSACLHLKPNNLRGLVREHEVFDGAYRIDFALPRFRLAIELDGYSYHSGPDAFVYDRRRDRYLSMNHWVVVHFAGAEVMQDPQRCVHEADLWAGAWRRERSRR
jgi:very-short-patch-repair endonuclease